MIYLKNILTGSKVSNSIKRFISLYSSSSIFNPNPISLASIFAKNPSKSPKNNKPSTSKSANGKLQIKDNKAPSESKKLLVQYAKKLGEREFPNELSAGATMLIDRLIKDGYLEDANFSKGQELQPNTISKNFYSRHYLKVAAEKFGRKHQQYAK